MDEETKLIYETLKKDVISFHARWQVYKQLFVDNGNIDLLYVYTSFVFYIVQNLLIDDVILTFSRITDPAKYGHNMNCTLVQLISKLSNDPAYSSLIVILNAKFVDLKNKCKNFRDHRNKAIAHSDLNLSLYNTLLENPDSDAPIPPVVLEEVKIKEIEDTLNSVREFMNEIERFVYNKTVAYELTRAPLANGYALIGLIKDAMKYRMENNC